MIQRLERALQGIGDRLSHNAGAVGLIVFGSYARGEYELKSDLDLLILFEGDERPDGTEAGTNALRIVGEVESAERLPMHIAPMLASVDRAEDLGSEFLHNVWADGVVLYARTGALARLKPGDLAPGAVIRFTLAGARSEERVRLSRRLHGMKGRGGILRPPAITLGRGVLLVPATQQAAVRSALDEAGATYDVIPVWREM